MSGRSCASCARGTRPSVDVGRARPSVASRGTRPSVDVARTPARVLVSACLLGECVRYDGGHRRDPFVAETLGRVVVCVPVCPEVECGLPVPREPMRLAGDADAPRLVTIRTGVDHTARMARFASARLRKLAALGLCGYVCKKGSPSCGMGKGLFARAFAKRFPLVPVEEEGRLRAAAARERFVEAVITMKRFRDVVGRRRSRRAVAAFHAGHEAVLRARGRTVFAEMGRLLARTNALPARTLVARYGELLAKALSRRGGRSAAPARRR